MINKTTLTRLKKRVELEVSEKLPAVLLSKAVEKHCKKHSGCDCDYCRAKSYGTYNIGLVGQNYRKDHFWFDDCYFNTYRKTSILEKIERDREFMREDIRQKLEQLKQVIL